MICANKECNKEFERKTHNQKYCSDDCCRIATNKRIMEKYYEKKAIRNGAERKCNHCKIQLSRYNDLNICSACQRRIDYSQRQRIKGLIDEVS